MKTSEYKARALDALARAKGLADTDFGLSQDWRTIGEAWAAVAIAAELKDALAAKVMGAEADEGGGQLSAKSH